MPRIREFILCLLAVSIGSGQPATPVPTFEPGRVLPSNREVAIPLSPGLLVSIYGEHLGPAAGCTGQADPHQRETPNPAHPRPMFVDTLTYPKELCDTKVLVDGMSAGLLYVQERQINFKVPQEVPIEGSLTVQVIYKGQTSRAAMFPAGFEGVSLSLESSAKVGMPVWLNVSTPSWASGVRYPFDTFPASFKCHEVEVRRDGKLLPRDATLFTQAFGRMIAIGPPCGSLGLSGESLHTGRIPLHLQYRFDQPGIYEVRYTLHRDYRPEGPVVIQSPWTPIEILPGSAAERAEWLRERSAHAPSGAVELLTDYLPSILGVADKASLALLVPYLYHPDELVRRYAMSGLTYWPEADANSAVLDAVRAYAGPSDAAAQFLIRRPESAAANAGTLVESAIPSLNSGSRVLLRGAVTAISRAALTENFHISADLRSRAETAMIEAADHVARTADPQTITDYTSALGLIKDARASAVLWGFTDRNIARGQALIALTWRHSPADLPKLVQLTLAARDGSEMDRDLNSLPYAIHHGYGDDAIPYLETMMRRSGYTWVRTNSAQELILAGRPAGFAFAADAIENAKPYRLEMTAWVRGRFPELRQADDAAVLAFAKARAAKQ